MYKRYTKGWLKHFDFMVLDLLVLQSSFLLSYFLRHGFLNPYSIPVYATMGIFLMLCDLIIIFLTESFHNVMKRGYYQEFAAILQQTAFIELSAIFFLFSFKIGEEYSRISMYLMGILYAVIGYFARLGWKLFIKKTQRVSKRSLLIVTDQTNAAETIQNLRNNSYGLYHYAGLVLVHDDPAESEICDIPVVANINTAAEYVQKAWIDEVFISLPESVPIPHQLIEDLSRMGITVHLTLAQVSHAPGKRQIIERIGSHTVLTISMNYVTTKQAFFKRTLDILGGLVGCLITAVLFVFIAPLIYINSPGPIFFVQERIGRNGKLFQMYKFRSMYMDAEASKHELMSQNKISSDLMFKLDFDPRIIGNKTLPDGTYKTGIGQFIRNTSIDEFPQFFNVLKGDMSLVGTRPPLVSEFNAYEQHHRARMSVKPGITGMWQISGRSDITDFEEVVRLDTQYINEWSIGLDLKIILKTVIAVLTRKGSL